MEQQELQTWINAYPDLQNNFDKPEKLHYDLVLDMSQAIPQKIKEKLQPLDLSLIRVVQEWDSWVKAMVGAYLTTIT